MAYVPYSPQIGCKYVLTGPNGQRAVFNDQTDADFVGQLTEITGLDSPEVRESADDLPSADGGQHGNFFFGRRPITMTGTVYGHSSMLERDTRLDKLRQASNCLQADGTLVWQNLPLASTLPMFTTVRRQQRLNISGNWVKEFQVLLVSEFAPLWSATSHDSGFMATGVCENKGDYPSPPIITVRGGSSATVVENQTTGKQIKFTAAMDGSDTVVDVINHAATVGGVAANSRIDFVNSTWPTVNKGNNTFRIAAGPGTLRVQWYDAWS